MRCCNPKGSTHLRLGDGLYVIERTDDLPVLNRLFNGDARLKRERAFFGTFTAGTYAEIF